MSSEPESTRLEPVRRQCDRCSRMLWVQKTRKRFITTLAGPIEASIVTRHCPDHKDMVSRPKNDISPPKSIYGYDVIAETGRLRFIENKQVREIHQQFLERGIHIPERTIYDLCDRFLLYVTAVHREGHPAISRLLKKRGGYVLHVDSSGHHGPMILLLRDSWSGVRLHAAPIRSEAAEWVIPHLQEVKVRFGDPLAIVRDMSKGFKAAIETIFPGVYVIVCHYHFLQAVGMRLFEPYYPRFRGRIDRRGVKKRLRSLQRTLQRRAQKNEEESLALSIVEDILAYPKDGKGLGYPFSLPNVDFYRRCLDASVIVRKAIMDQARNNIHSPILSHLEDSLRLLSPPPAVLGRLHADYEDLERRWSWFQRIRKVLRYRNGPIPLSTRVHLSDRDLEKGRLKLDWLLCKIEEVERIGNVDGHTRSLRKDLRKLATLIKEHRHELFAPNVKIVANGRTAIRKLPRTNEPVETDFRMARRHLRRIRGNSDVEPQFQREGAGLLIAHNLRHREYVRMVYGTLGQMAARFAKVSQDSPTPI